MPETIWFVPETTSSITVALVKEAGLIKRGASLLVTSHRSESKKITRGQAALGYYGAVASTFILGSFCQYFLFIIHVQRSSRACFMVDGRGSTFGAPVEVDWAVGF